MSGFTKGPWYPVKNSVDQWEVMTLRDADFLSENWRDSIGYAYGASICMGIGDHTESRTRGNEEANARLIAAAPELYEACQTFAEWLRREDAGSEGQSWAGKRGTPEGEAAWREWYDENLRLCALAQEQALAALSKAAGKGV